MQSTLHPTLPLRAARDAALLRPTGPTGVCEEFVRSRGWSGSRGAQCATAARGTWLQAPFAQQQRRGHSTRESRPPAHLRRRRGRGTGAPSRRRKDFGVPAAAKPSSWGPEALHEAVNDAGGAEANDRTTSTVHPHSLGTSSWHQLTCAVLKDFKGPCNLGQVAGRRHVQTVLPLFPGACPPAITIYKYCSSLCHNPQLIAEARSPTAPDPTCTPPAVRVVAAPLHPPLRGALPSVLAPCRRATPLRCLARTTQPSSLSYI